VPPAVESLDIDVLTGLCTRPALRHLLAQALRDMPADGPYPALLALDLDRFQAVNDSTGIATGDGVLSRVARRLLAAAPPGATVARISGDEFAVLLPDGRDAEPVAVRLLDLIGRAYAVNGHAVTLSVSIGLALAPQHGSDADAVLRSSNIALHLAEADGKNRWCQFEPWMQEKASSRQTLETDLRAALALNKNDLRKTMAVEQFELHYQPQVTLSGRQITGFEALVRWRHPVRGMVGPNDFIPLCEEIGLIGLLGDWVIRTACRTAASWPVPRHGHPLSVAVNVSPLQLRERRALVASIAEALNSSGLAPERLEVEITESALIGDALETLQAIKALGVSLSLDDFGTGYSSLSQLAHYPFDRLKIDRSFVRDLPEQLPAPWAAGSEVDESPAPRLAPLEVGATAAATLSNGSACGASHSAAKPDKVAAQAQWMIQAVAALGAGLGMATVAEGVETEMQAQLVRQAGVTDMQGYLIARPTPEAGLVDLIERLDAASAAAPSIPDRSFPHTDITGVTA
jgi:diguanylate cyclase (GGDEF)-like protein